MTKRIKHFYRFNSLFFKWTCVKIADNEQTSRHEIFLTPRFIPGQFPPFYMFNLCSNRFSWNCEVTVTATRFFYLLYWHVYDNSLFTVWSVKKKTHKTYLSIKKYISHLIFLEENNFSFNTEHRRTYM